MQYGKIKENNRRHIDLPSIAEGRDVVASLLDNDDNSSEDNTNGSFQYWRDFTLVKYTR